MVNGKLGLIMGSNRMTNGFLETQLGSNEMPMEISMEPMVMETRTHGSSRTDFRIGI
jgi:hypothetical protein